MRDPYNPAAPKRVFHNMSADLWQRGCERLAAELPEQQFNTWIRPLPAADVADDVVTVRVPNRFKLDWIRNQYAGRIEAVLTELAGRGVGLGKTHLIHAVGNALLADKPDARILYLHAEQFITDVVKNYQRKTFDELKAKYHSLDLLLIDDVQFFAGKERTQEEFFNAFEALLAKRAHIIMTSDTYPKGLVDIDERLTSRFDAGLTVAIEAPELEMRVAILIRKADIEGTQMPEDVAFFIAKNVRANVRELEGALRKVLAYSRFSQKDINIQLAREALKDLLSIQNRQISVENIQKTVADFYKIKVADMYSKKRPASIARPRQIAMYLAKELTQKSLPEIGELFGGRDHTTVLHAVRKISAERQKNTELNQQLHVLEQTLKG